MHKPITSLNECNRLRNNFEKRIQGVLDANKSRLERLVNFTHGFKTSASKKILTNQDAIVIAFHDVASFTSREARVILCAWHFKSFDAKDLMLEIRKWDTRLWLPEGKKYGPEFTCFSEPKLKLESTYLFNITPFGGYGFAGRTVYSSGEKRRGTSKDNIFWRKHCWYRVCKGRYGMTEVGMVRAGELKSANFFS